MLHLVLEEIEEIKEIEGIEGIKEIEESCLNKCSLNYERILIHR